VLLQLNQIFTSRKLQVECVTLISTGRGVFIGVQRVVTHLVKSVTRQLGADRPSHVVGRPWSSASTNLQLGIPLYLLLESVTAKPTHERLQGGATWLGDLAGQPPRGPTGQRLLHTTSSCQVYPRGDIYFGGIPNFLAIS
jgi:hypothetical protein